MSETVQYVIVGIIILATILWIVARTVKNQKKKTSGCCGCSLQDACAKNHKESDCNRKV